ncbi:hypothetical protein CANARDRAFT_213130 [[Candida] arabinofermentans NRRL YB-2248]|uniref:Get5 N-terminal domain-containing protein n=1 Tax=[Candida] arabinofermentans NRRL YB-2248 TaxID=983967 RepID=A0A1E4T031_9ASCO|nr:hypothetical protein CANARDRAFT_213130 [[Candida] arabinofermentans NRRL YB-2248]
MSVATELEFASKFQSLIKFVSSSKTFESDYAKNLTELDKVEKFAFPKIANPPLFKRSSGAESKTITVTFKSLRQPKFSIAIQTTSNVLVHKIKAAFVEELNKQSVDGVVYSIEQIKLMLKTKTVHDGDTLSKYLADESASELTLNVLISKATTATPLPELMQEVEADLGPDITTIVPKFTGLSEKAWADIYEILKREIADADNRDSYFESLKKASL